jgi:quercetin 2,3-dioxygenase
MANLDSNPGPVVCAGRGEVLAEPVAQLLPGREAPLEKSARVRDAGPSHPHIGPQTVSWLRAREIERRDGLGSHTTPAP